MHAKKLSRALLWSLVCIAVGCSNLPPEEQPVASSTSQLLAVGWEATGAMAEARKFHAGVVLPSGKVLVTGGSRGATFLASATVYEPATGAWTVVAPMPQARQAHTATVLNTGKVLVAGGESAGFLSSTAVYDPASNTWASAGTFATGVARAYLTATVLADGRVLVTGGLSNGAHGRVDVYDPVAGTWAVGPTMATGRRSHTATLLQNGKVLVVGGWIGGPSPATGTTEIFNPVTNTWSATGALATGRYDHTATLLPNGKVLVVGGRGNAGVVGSAELYDPATGTWSAASAPVTARELHSATLSNTGKVLVAGGKNGSALGSTEVYDPGTGQWTATTSMGGARSHHVAVALASLGKVLVVGGLGATGSSLGTAELYEHSSNPCSGVICNTPPGACFDSQGTCSNGSCTYSPKASGASCNDGDACTGTDVCNGAGVCAGSATQCSSPPGQCYEGAGTCNGGACDYAYKASGAVCNDQDACTVGEVCNGIGGCMGTPVSCNSPPGQCYQAAGTCSGGACTYAPKAAGSACNDGNAGTLNDVCNGAGVCAGGVACTTPPSACHDSPGTFVNGACTYPFKGAGTACNDGNACTTGDVCNGAGACGGATLSCNSPPSQCYQAAGTCSNGACSYALMSAGTACNDGNACTTGDTCNGAGACGGTAMSCSTASSTYCSGNDIRRTAGTGTCSGGACGSTDSYIQTCQTGTSGYYCSGSGVYQTVYGGCVNSACRVTQQLVQTCSSGTEYYCNGNERRVSSDTGTCSGGSCGSTDSHVETCSTQTSYYCSGNQVWRSTGNGCSNGSCSSTDAIVQACATGQTCSNGACIANNCPSTVVSWSQSRAAWNGNPGTAGTYSCTGVLSAASSGSQASATSLYSNRTGSATYTCNNGSWTPVSGLQTCDGAVISTTAATGLSITCSGTDPVSSMFVSWYLIDFKRCADTGGLTTWVHTYNTSSFCSPSDNYGGHGSKDACYRDDFRAGAGVGAGAQPWALYNEAQSTGHITSMEATNICGTLAYPYSNVSSNGTTCKYRP